MESQLANLAITLEDTPKTGWFDLPFEIRSDIIEMMDTKSKGRLSSCSKVCCYEVRSSKNFINVIKLTWTPNAIHIEVRVQDCTIEMEFSEVPKDKGKCLMSFKSYWEFEQACWEKNVEGDFADVGLEYFTKYVNDAIFLEEIVIDSDGFPFEKISLTHLKKLKRVRIEKTCSVDLLQCGFLSAHQLASISTLLELEDTNMGLDQLASLKAEKIHLNRVQLSPTDLNQYLKLWKDNQINKNIRKMKLEFKEANDFYDATDDIVKDLDVTPNYNGYVIKKNGLLVEEKWFKIKKVDTEMVDLRVTRDSFLMVHGTSENDIDQESYTSDDYDPYDVDSEYFDDYIDRNVYDFDDYEDFDEYVDPLYNYGDDDNDDDNDY